MTMKYKPKAEVVVMCGIPGVGKSFFVENFLPYHQRVNLDSIHAMLSSEGFDKANLELGRNIEDLVISYKLAKGIPIVIDNTSVTKEKRVKYIEVAKKYSVPAKAIYFEPDVKLALAQNAKRDRKVPQVAIRTMASSFQIPEKEEGFVAVYNARSPDMFGTKPAVFLDRDGVILEDMVDGKNHFTNKVKDITFYPNSLGSLRTLSKKGYDLVIVSNQAGVANGSMSAEDLEEINSHLMKVFSREGINVKDIFCCIHPSKGSCKCRKPKTGMVIQAANMYGLDLKSSYMIGDATSDIELGNRLRLKTFLVQTGFAGKDGKFNPTPTYTVKDISEAADMVPTVK